MYAALAAIMVMLSLLAGRYVPAWAAHGGVPAIVSVRADYVQRLRESGEPVLFVDLRKAAEFAAGHLPGAASLPMACSRAATARYPAAAAWCSTTIVQRRRSPASTLCSAPKVTRTTPSLRAAIEGGFGGSTRWTGSAGVLPGWLLVPRNGGTRIRPQNL